MPLQQGRMPDDEAAADTCMPKPRPPSRLKHMPMGGSVLVPSVRHTEYMPMNGHRRNHHAHASVRRLRDRSLFGCSRFGHTSGHPSRWIPLFFVVFTFRRFGNLRQLLLRLLAIQLQACTLSWFARERFAFISSACCSGSQQKLLLAVADTRGK